MLNAFGRSNGIVITDLRSQVREYRRFGTYCLLCSEIGRIVSIRSLLNYTSSRYITHQSAPLVPFLSQKYLPIVLKSHLATNLLFLFHLRLDLPSRRFLWVKRQRLSCFRLVSTVHEARPAAFSVLKRLTEGCLSSVSLVG